MSEKRSLTLPVLRQCVGFNIKKIKKDVDLSNQQLTDLDALKLLPKPDLVENLNAAENVIEEVEGVLVLKQLKVLKLKNNKIRSIKGFEKLLQLEEVDLSNNDLTNVSFLHPKVRRLNLSGNARLTLPRVLLGNVHLTELRLVHCGLLKPAPFCSMRSLRALDVSHNELLSLDFLLGMTQLEDLFFRGNHIRQVSTVLPKLTGLKIVDSRDNPIEDLGALKLPKDVKLFKNNGKKKEKEKEQEHEAKTNKAEAREDGPNKQEAGKIKEEAKKTEKKKKKKKTKEKQAPSSGLEGNAKSAKRAKVSTAEDAVQQALQGAVLDAWD